MTGFEQFQGLPLERFSFEWDVIDRRGNITDHLRGESMQFSQELRSGPALEMVAVTGGTFQMGSPHGQGYEDETPRHLVSLAPFLLGRYPVTQAQWQAVMGKAPRGRFSGA